MPALTVDTESVSPRTSDPASAAAAAASAAAQQQQQQQQTNATSATASASTPAPAPARPGSPSRPPMSPITPPLNAAALPPIPQSAATKLPPPATTAAAQAQPQAQPQATFATNRQTFTHAPVPDASATAIPPPAPEPIDFDSNPDVLALKSAISILQLQRQRATNDIRALGSAKDAALQSPEAFIEDLTSGRIRGTGDPLFPQAAGAEDSDSSSDETAGEGDGQGSQDVAGGVAPRDGDQTAAMDVDPPSAGAVKKKGKTKIVRQRQPWTDLPRPQNIVRCPPINWSQYAVAGDSLDRLHAEQQARPSQGQPAVMGPGGTFEFRAGGENQMDFTAIAAPYTPGKDKLDKKPKGGRR